MTRVWIITIFIGRARDEGVDECRGSHLEKLPKWRLCWLLSHSKMACEKHGHLFLWRLYKTATICLTNPDMRLGRAEKNRMETWEAASISRRVNYCAPSRSVPLELSEYGLSLLQFVLIVWANISCLLFLFSVFSLSVSLCVCHTSRPLPVSCPPCPQGFLKNERDNALLSAIEESRRRVSICPMSDCFSGWKHMGDGI